MESANFQLPIYFFFEFLVNNIVVTGKVTACRKTYDGIYELFKIKQETERVKKM